MLQIAVCDDEVIECCNMARKVKAVLEEMKIPFLKQGNQIFCFQFIRFS